MIHMRIPFVQFLEAVELKTLIFTNIIQDGI